ncbi:MAG: hypothetical protein M1832_005415 [Thelocarpon impressellum]|nr:MAG: hypothetical protein M1832_005415 [Thelocarpon impressellum]
MSPPPPIRADEAETLIDEQEYPPAKAAADLVPCVACNTSHPKSEFHPDMLSLEPQFRECGTKAGLVKLCKHDILSFPKLQALKRREKGVNAAHGLSLSSPGHGTDPEHFTELYIKDGKMLLKTEWLLPALASATERKSLSGFNLALTEFVSSNTLCAHSSLSGDRVAQMVGCANVHWRGMPCPNAQCSYPHRCRSCPTEIDADISDARGARYLRVTTWRSLGAGESPDDPDWVAQRSNPEIWPPPVYGGVERSVELRS